MKKVTISSVFIILLISFQFCFGQENSKARLFRKFDPTPCENYASILDLWFFELSQTPDAVGYAIVRGSKDKLLVNLFYKEMINGQLLWRSSQMKTVPKIKIVEQETNESLEVELWSVSKDAEIPFRTDTKWDYTLRLDKGAIFYESGNDGGICPFVDNVKLFAALLQANPDLRGNIVFYESSQRKFRARKKDFLAQIKGVSPARLRFYFSETYYGAYYELWLVPKKK